jgi:hypothetical protein
MKTEERGEWSVKTWSSRQAFVPPCEAIIYGRRDHIFRGEVSGHYISGDAARPFLKFVVETSRHRIVFGIMPKPSGLELTAGQIKLLTPGEGVVEFNNGAIYKKPNYRTIELVELPAVERLANMTEMQLAGLRYASKAKPRRVSGSRGRRPTYTAKELTRVENAIRQYNGSLRATAEALGKPVAEIKRMHDASRHRKGRLSTPRKTE